MLPSSPPHQVSAGTDPRDSSNQDQARQDAISILQVSRYGSNDIVARFAEYHVEPTAHDAGGTHTVSAGFVSAISGRPIDKILAMEKAQECFFKIEWAFSQHQYPKLTTRHRLSPNKTLNISFSGGLDWAKRLLKYTQFLDSASPPGSAAPISGTIVPPLQHPSKSEICVPEVPDYDNIEDNGIFLGTSSINQDPERNEDDQASIFSEPSSVATTTASTTSHTFGHSSVFSSWSCPDSRRGRIASGSSEGYNTDTDATLSGEEEDCRAAEEENSNSHCEAQTQTQIAALREKRKQAEALYARTGDSSRIIALLALAQGIPEAWDSCGHPRFQSRV